MSKAQKIFNKLHDMKLSQQARNFIVGCDQIAMVDLFEYCDTAEEVEELIKEYLDEE